MDTAQSPRLSCKMQSCGENMKDGGRTFATFSPPPTLCRRRPFIALSERRASGFAIHAWVGTLNPCHQWLYPVVLTLSQLVHVL